MQNGMLYGVGDKGGIYTVSKSAKAVKVSQLTVALEAEYFGVDFNPPANRLRVISDTGQNLRHNIDDPAAPRTTTTDGTLTNPTTPPSTALGVTGAAYTNNDLNVATATTLFHRQLPVPPPPRPPRREAERHLGLDEGEDVVCPTERKSRPPGTARQAAPRYAADIAARRHDVGKTVKRTESIKEHQAQRA